jgi:CDP-diacylglycerol--glycerol-3-phosphate 3-phosphatidyltransferase
MRTADKITFCRIILAPIIFIVYFIPDFFEAFARASIAAVIPLAVFAECTDFLDGLYARKHNAVSGFGKLFDPFADVMLHLTLFMCCAFSGYMPLFLLLLIVYREFAMLFVRLLAAQKGVAIGARKGGKAKTVLYCAASFLTLALEAARRFGVETPSAFNRVLTVVFALCAVMAYVSFVDYIVHFKKILVQPEQPS